MIKGQSLKQLYESLGPVECCARISENLASGEFKPDDFSLRELAESFCGPEWVRRLNPRNLARFDGIDVPEAGEGVDVSAFSNITGQLAYSRIHQGWNQDGMIGDMLFENVPTSFDGEKIPGLGMIGPEGYNIRPGMPYPEAGFSEQYWETPSTTKQGEILSLTKEAIFYDRTGLFNKRASQIGERARFRKEKKQLAVFAGITITLPDGTSFNGNNHKWKGTTYNTYDTSSNAIGINAKSGVTLDTWEDINEAEQLFNGLTDPDTGNPILITPDTLVCHPARYYTAKRIQTATEVRSGDGASASMVQISGNPVKVQTVLMSRLLAAMIVNSGVSAANSKDWWFYGQPKKAFWYMQNWDFTVVQSPPNSIKEFEQDIVARWKASEKGVPYSADPRYMVKMYGS